MYILNNNIHIFNFVHVSLLLCLLLSTEESKRKLEDLGVKRGQQYRDE